MAMIFNADTATPLQIIKEKVQPESMVYTDSFKAYVMTFIHRRIIRLTIVAEERNQINVIKNFWNQAKAHLSRFNGV
jgi:transposase